MCYFLHIHLSLNICLIFIQCIYQLMGTFASLLMKFKLKYNNTKKYYQFYGQYIVFLHQGRHYNCSLSFTCKKNSSLIIKMYANQCILVSNTFLRIKIRCDKMKKKIPYCRNSSKNSINRGHIHDLSLSWLGTGSLIKSGCVKLYLWA